jgi:aspartate/methionine/tyrosine aminotransferase
LPVLSLRPSIAVSRVEEATLRVQQPSPTGRLVSLAMGEPDLPTPPQITAAMTEALTAGYTHYAHQLGDPDLREEIAQPVEDQTGQAGAIPHATVRFRAIAQVGRRAPELEAGLHHVRPAILPWLDFDCRR